MLGWMGAGMEVVVGMHAARRDWLYVGMDGGRHGGCGLYACSQEGLVVCWDGWGQAWRLWLVSMQPGWIGRKLRLVGAGMEVVVCMHAARRDWLYVGMDGGRHGGCGW